LFSTLFDAPRPITASAAVSKDEFGNVWVYAGTGRYFSTEDKTNEDTQYIFGIKDPFFNSDRTTLWAKDGWIKPLSIPKERILTRPAILGGIVFAPSFVPNDDICGFGGDSYLYGLYYETGTAYYNSVFDQGTITVEIEGQEIKQVLDKTALGFGMASSLGIHVGTEEGATGFVQQSTGNILIEGLSPAFNIKSGLRSWREK